MLRVGKKVVTAKQREGCKDQLFPQTIVVSERLGLAPLQKVWADYDPSNNEFIVKINGNDYYTLEQKII